MMSRKEVLITIAKTLDSVWSNPHTKETLSAREYEDLELEMRAILNEILQSIILETDLKRIGFPELSAVSRELMKRIDKIVWNYLVFVEDTAGIKQILRDLLQYGFVKYAQ